ncbi:FKBP-type peptidyl-prolyl cis-trans isomerase [Hahella sp. SMD15-11]|uniref:Peptidyl-prolyl cis-trans isomerase n=1 Tax=Thermohahella caldifontis TaxID=3142973 RepID=A0AB39V109_9GAMM
MTKVYTIHYKLKNRNGEVVDTSVGGQPMTFLDDSPTVIPGLRKAVAGREPGQVLEVTIPPELAYGPHDPDKVRTVARALFDQPEAVKPGAIFQTGSGNERQVVKVVDVDGDKVRVDANHPLAGLTLYFEVEILSVRDATPDEIASGKPFHP